MSKKYRSPLHMYSKKISATSKQKQIMVLLKYRRQHQSLSEKMDHFCRLQSEEMEGCGFQCCTFEDESFRLPCLTLGFDSDDNGLVFINSTWLSCLL